MREDQKSGGRCEGFEKVGVKVFKSVGPACITVLSGQVQGITIKIYLDKMKVKSL